MGNGRTTDYYVMYTLDGEVKDEISTTKPSIIYDVILGRGKDTVYLDIICCDLIKETETVKSKHQFTLDELGKMDKDHFKKLLVGLLSYDDMEHLKSWF